MNTDYYNQTSNNTTSEGKNRLFLDILKTMSHTLYSIIFVLGIIGNGLVIWIAGFRMKKTISAVWFLNLASADFLCCASITLRIAQWTFISHDKSKEFFVFCLLTIILFSINMSASVLLLTAMSIDRCVSVMWPFWAKIHKTIRLVRITAGVIWVLSLLITGLMSFLYGLYLYDFNEWCVIDVFAGNSYMIKQIVQMIRLVIMFVIPFLIILTNYVMIFLKLRKSKRSQRSQRPYRIITAVILCFFICWCPYYIWPLTPMYDGANLQFYIVNTIVTTLATLNSCMNPIIYVFMSEDIKLGFLRSIPARVERALNDHPEAEDGEHTRTTDV